jgi:hypothetical protein
MSRFAGAGKALALGAALTWASAAPAAVSAEPRILTASYTGFTFIEPVACGGSTDAAMMCFDLIDTDTHIEVVIHDEVAGHVIGFASLRFANGDRSLQGHFCDSWSYDVMPDVRGAPTKLVISVEPHAFVGACTYNPADLPVGGTATAILT